jgi:hypothetical protein
VIPACEPEPAFWARLDLPASEADRAEGLAELLRQLRVPAAVRHSPSEGGTFALVPLDDDGSPLAVTDTYGPKLRWSLLDRDRLLNGLSSLAGRGSTLDGESIEQLADEPDDGLGPDDTAQGRTGRVDAIAWTTHEQPGVLAALGARFDMSFVAVDAAEMGLALTVHDPADRDRAFTNGVWAMTDGVAMWRSGEEASAAFIHRRGAVIMTWRTPWRWVDPSKSGQVDHDGATVSAMLHDLVLDDGDPAAWVTRFRLDQEGGDRLRALFRRGPHAEALDDLCEILRIHPSLLAVLSDDGESYAGRTMITAASARQQFRDEMRAKIEAAAPGPQTFRGRHPRIWLGLSAFVIVVLAAVAVMGWSDGRPTALLPGLVALVWTASLVTDGSVRRARRADSSELAPARDGRDR